MTTDIAMPMWKSRYDVPWVYISAGTPMNKMADWNVTRMERPTGMHLWLRLANRNLEALVKIIVIGWFKAKVLSSKGPQVIGWKFRYRLGAGLYKKY